MLTRHWYDVSEVLAALAWCGSRNVVAETVFWCKELVISGYAAEAIRALFESWLWHRGPYHPEWLVEAQRVLGGDEVTEEGILSMAAALSRCRVRDHSLGWVWVTPVERLRERVTPRGPRWLSMESSELELYFHRAAHQRRGGAAWWAASQASEAEAWRWLERWLDQEVIKALRGYEGLWGASAAEMDRCVLAAGVLMACARDGRPEVDRRMEVDVTEWDRVRGRRAGRVYAIPLRALYGVRVRDTSRGLFAVAEAEAEAEAEASDWPDDLPDEWDRAEKEKSHGPAATVAVTLSGWMRRDQAGWCRLFWRAERWVEDRPLGEPYATLLGAGSAISRKAIDPLPLQPVHKRPKIAQAIRAPL